MPVQNTSMEAYYEKLMPMLGKRHQEVLNSFIYSSFTNLTNMELANALGWSINRVTPRVFELRKLGLLQLDEKRKCKITGNRAMAWTTVRGVNYETFLLGKLLGDVEGWADWLDHIEYLSGDVKIKDYIPNDVFRKFHVALRRKGYRYSRKGREWVRTR